MKKSIALEINIKHLLLLYAFCRRLIFFQYHIPEPKAKGEPSDNANIVEHSKSQTPELGVQVLSNDIMHAKIIWVPRVLCLNTTFN